MWSFNPRTHIGCDLLRFGVWSPLQQFQSTHPHRVRPFEIDRQIVEVEFQSTHPHRVRLTPELKQLTDFCFNPRTHIGCDGYLVILVLRLKSFNPRTHIGCDFEELNYYKDFEVSIHAPTLGATCRFLCRFCMILSFNPRTHIGCDFKLLKLINSSLSFNPRTHIGCDLFVVCLFHLLLVSIHAPT